MKKLITIFVALIATFAVMAQGTFPVSPGYGSGVEATFRQRVIDSGGTSYPNIAPHIFSEQHSYGLLPIFQMIPAATEDSVLFAQYPTDGSGDMMVVNAGTKFVTNSDGLLEEIAANIAAIDYTNGTPSVKLNEANTNLLEYPLSFDNAYWTKSGATVTGGHSSPSVTYPTDAYLFTATAGGGSIKLTTPLASAAYNNSWYVKRATGTGVVSLVDASDTDIEIAVTGGWQRFDANATGTQCGLKLATSGDAVYIAFAQTSAKTYAPTFTYSGTEGATSSMLADAITGGGDAATFASVNASGVLYAEIAFSSAESGHYITLSDRVNDRIVIGTEGDANTIRVYVVVGGAVQATLGHVVADITVIHKIAARWDTNDFSLWIDGIKQDTDSSGSVFPALELNELALDNAANAAFFYGNTKQVAVYNYLDDSQMSELTTP